MAIYEIANTGRHDMGHGLKATATIPAGTRILAETPLFITSYAFFQRAPTAERENTLAAQLIAQFTKAQRNSFLALTNNNATIKEERAEWIDAVFTGVILTNAIPLQHSPGREQYGKLGVFTELSRVNHGCRPNAQQTWNEDLQQETLHALHNISPGEEITISYNQTDNPDWLKDIYGFQYVFTRPLFECLASCSALRSPLSTSLGPNLSPLFEYLASCGIFTSIVLISNISQDVVHSSAWILTPMIRCVCEYCLYEGREADNLKKASAVNRQRIDDLSCALENAGTPREELANCWERLALVKQEHIVDYRAGMVYLDAFDVALEMKDKERAKLFAKYAEDVVGNCEGEDSCALRVMREELAELRRERDAQDDAEDVADQRSDASTGKMINGGEEADGRPTNCIDKGKGRAEDGYRGYESQVHWLFMVKRARQDDEEDECA